MARSKTEKQETSRGRAAGGAGGGRLLVGVLHLPPLPGAPGRPVPLERVIPQAMSDAELLLSSGFDGLIVENFGDAPFFRDDVPPVTVAAMTRVVHAIRGMGTFPLGVNVLRNDASAALAVAVGAGADFIRVNIHMGAFATDQGVIEGKAFATLRERRVLGADTVEIWADVLCKHASPLGGLSLEEHAKDLVERGRADKLILTGTRTGEAVSAGDLDRVAGLRLGRDVLVGSGLTDANAPDYARAAGALVGSWIRKGGKAGRPLDPERVRRLAAAWKAVP
jgi:membrane complex biogenesis BtpA family protein